MGRPFEVRCSAASVLDSGSTTPSAGSVAFFTDEAKVVRLAVLNTHERRGFGTLLMDAAGDWARPRTPAHLTLETGAANRAARAFYNRCGYQEEDIRLTKTLD